MTVYIAAGLVVALPIAALISVLRYGHRAPVAPAVEPAWAPDWKQPADTAVVIYEEAA